MSELCINKLATRPILYTDTLSGEQTMRDDLWAVTTTELNHTHNIEQQRDELLTIIAECRDAAGPWYEHAEAMGDPAEVPAKMKAIRVQRDELLELCNAIQNGQEFSEEFCKRLDEVIAKCEAAK